MKIRFILLLAGLFFYSCKGDMGPEGVPGPKGDTGAPGAQGQKGDTGAAGTANVLQYTFAPVTPVRDMRNYHFSNLPAGTSLQNSLVMVYGKMSFLSFWTPIPGLIYVNSSRTEMEFFSFVTETSTHLVVYRMNPTTGQILASNALLQTRVLIVPASILRNGRYPSDFFNDYKRVQAEFNLPD